MLILGLLPLFLHSNTVNPVQGSPATCDWRVNEAQWRK